MMTEYVRGDVEAFLAMLKQASEQADNGAAPPFPPLYELTPEQARAAYQSLVQMGDLPAHELARIEEVHCPGPDGDIPMRIYDTRAALSQGGAGRDGVISGAAEGERAETGSLDMRPAIIFFHGGGFVVGGLDSYHSICTDAALRTGLPVISVDYRLAPEHPFPAAPDDCEAAARYIAANAGALGLTLSGLITMGDSAGGNLAIVTALALAKRPAALPVLLQVPIYPVAGPIDSHASFHAYNRGYVLDLPTLAWFTSNYAGDAKDWRCYPILSSDLAASPPSLIVTAGLDPLRDSGREYAAKLIEHGVDVSYMEANGTVHMFMNLRKIMPSGQSFMQDIYKSITTLARRAA